MPRRCENSISEALLRGRSLADRTGDQVAYRCHLARRYACVRRPLHRRLRHAAANSLYHHEILYLDSEAVFVMADDMYDRGGQLFVNYTSWLYYADRAEPDAKIAIYPFKREFQPGSSSQNLQSGFSTVCYHPSQNAPSHDCWFINMGSVDRNWFTPEQMARAAEGGHAVSGD